jgi:hypothetical protein
MSGCLLIVNYTIFIHRHLAYVFILSISLPLVTLCIFKYAIRLIVECLRQGLNLKGYALPGMRKMGLVPPF